MLKISLLWKEVRENLAKYMRNGTDVNDNLTHPRILSLIYSAKPYKCQICASGGYIHETHMCQEQEFAVLPERVYCVFSFWNSCHHKFRSYAKGKDWGQEEKGVTGWDSCMASSTQWTWVWENSQRQWRTGKPGTQQSMVSQRFGHDLATEQQCKAQE